MLENIQGMKWFLQPNIFLKKAGEQKIYSPAVGAACPAPFQETYVLGNYTCSVPEKGFYIIKEKMKARKEEV